MLHHSSRDIAVAERTLKDGRIVPVKGQGFTHSRIWEEMEAKRASKKTTIWVENSAGEVVWTAPSKFPLAEIVKFRDYAFPGHAVKAWQEGFDSGVLIYRDTGQAQQPQQRRISKGKAKRRKR